MPGGISGTHTSYGVVGSDGGTHRTRSLAPIPPRVKGQARRVVWASDVGFAARLVVTYEQSCGSFNNLERFALV